jgi:hypothetical protein
VRFADGEVSEARWMTREQLQRAVTGGLDFVPDSVALVLVLL